MSKTTISDERLDELLSYDAGKTEDAPDWVRVAQDGIGERGGFWTCAAAMEDSPMYIRADLLAVALTELRVLRTRESEAVAFITKYGKPALRQDLPQDWLDAPEAFGITPLFTHPAISAERVTDAARDVLAVKPLIDAAENAAMYLDTGFIECPRCGHEVETKNTDAEDALRTALSAISHPSEPEQCAAPPAATSKPSPLTPLHIDLLRRGARGQFIWFHDQAGLHTSEVCAVGDLCRAGLAKEADLPAIPGPPCPPGFEITEAGRALVAAISEKTP